MHINELCDDTLLNIFSDQNLYSVRCCGEVCRRWRRLSKRSLGTRREITLYELFKRPSLPKGKQLNKALRWVLERCGSQLRSLNMADPDPEFRFVKANERTFKIIGHYCHELEELNFTCLLILNDFIHEWISRIDCSKLKRVDLDLSFNHYCPVHDGLSALYKACPKIEYLNISNSLNARAQDCGEKWPETLKEVYINHAWALTGYSVWSLVKCCPDLRVFSMCGHQCGMDAGLKFVFNHLRQLRVLRLDEYPGDTELGVQIGQLTNLRELYLSGSSMVNDEVITAVAKGCAKLETLDLSVQSGRQVECCRYGQLTDQGLLALAYHLPGLRHFYVERRSCITDHGLAAVFSNGRIETLALAGSDAVTDSALQALAAYCSGRLCRLDLSQLNNVSSSAILALCERWFEKCTRASGFHLELYLDEVSIDIEDFLLSFQQVTPDNVHEFVMEEGHDGDGEDGNDLRGQHRPRRTIRIHCDMLLTMYSH